MGFPKDGASLDRVVPDPPLTTRWCVAELTSNRFVPQPSTPGSDPRWCVPVPWCPLSLVSFLESVDGGLQSDSTVPPIVSCRHKATLRARGKPVGRGTAGAPSQAAFCPHKWLPCRWSASFPGWTVGRPQSAESAAAALPPIPAGAGCTGQRPVQGLNGPRRSAKQKPLRRRWNQPLLDSEMHVLPDSFLLT